MSVMPKRRTLNPIIIPRGPDSNMPLFVDQDVAFPSAYGANHRPPPSTPSPSSRATHMQIRIVAPRPRTSMTYHSAHLILPFMFAILFAITGAVVLTYSLDHREAIPPKIVTGLAISFGIVIFVWLCCVLCLYVRRRWNKGDVEAGYSAKSSIRGTDRGLEYKIRCKRSWKGCLWFSGRDEEGATADRNDKQLRFVDVCLGIWDLAKGWKSRRRARKNLEDRAASDDSLTKDLVRTRRLSESSPDDLDKVLEYAAQEMNGNHPTHQQRLQVVNRSDSQGPLRQTQQRRSVSNTSEFDSREVLSLGSNSRLNIDVSGENFRHHIRRHTSPPIPSTPNNTINHARLVQVPKTSQTHIHTTREVNRNILFNHSDPSRFAKGHNPDAQSLPITRTLDEVVKVRDSVDNIKSPKPHIQTSPKPAASISACQSYNRPGMNNSQHPTYHPYHPYRPQDRDTEAAATSSSARQPHLDGLQSAQAFARKLTLQIKD